MQKFETSIFNINEYGLPGPLIIGTFEKRAPGIVTFGGSSLLEFISLLAPAYDQYLYI